MLEKKGEGGDAPEDSQLRLLATEASADEGSRAADVAGAAGTAGTPGAPGAPGVVGVHGGLGLRLFPDCTTHFLWYRE